MTEFEQFICYYTPILLAVVFRGPIFKALALSMCILVYFRDTQKDDYYFVSIVVYTYTLTLWLAP